MTSVQVPTLAVTRWPKTDDELHVFVRTYLGLNIPRQRVCPDHVAPFEAFADAYFARHPVTIWKGSRGFSGKSTLLGTLSTMEALALGAGVTILGGSAAQSLRVHEIVNECFRGPYAPHEALLREPTMYDTRFRNGGWIRALMASQKSVRGPHSSRLRLDEIDEMELAILEAAQGQPMRQRGSDGELVQTQTVMCVTGDTLVLTNRGEVPIIEVTPQDKVLTRKGWRKVKAVALSGFKPVVEMELSNGRRLTCTDDHRVALATGGWGLPRDFRPGTRIAGIGIDNAPTQEPVTVVGISARGPHWVYDLSVEGDCPEFVGEGIVLHNSSTHQYPESTMTAMLRRAKENKWPVHTWCVASGTLVTTARGDVPVEEVTNEDLVLTRHGWRPVQHVTFMGHKDTIYVEVGGRTLVCTPDHLIAVPGGWLHADALTAYTVPSVRSDPRVLGRELVTLATPGCSVLEDVASSVITLHHQSFDAVAVSSTCRPVDAVGVHGKNVPVWDIGVHGAHEFVAEGIVVHNCYKESQGTRQHPGWLSPRDVERKKTEISRRMWCVPDDEPVDTLDGPVLMKNVEVGRYVRTRLGWRRITHKYESGVQSVYKVTLENGAHYRATGAHKVATPEGWVRTDSLRPVRAHVAGDVPTPVVTIDAVVSRVVSIEVEEPVRTWDIGVEEAHEFTVRGVLLHNSIEYDLGEPSIEDRAIDTDKVEAMFELPVEEVDGYEYREFRDPQRDHVYVTGADWARQQDWTVISTWDATDLPWRLVAIERVHRKPWPEMIERYSTRIVRYPGPSAHDATGLGDVVGDYLEDHPDYPTVGVKMVGNARKALFSEFVQAVEEDRLRAPRVPWFYDEVRYCANDDLFGTGHPPDSLVSAALAWSMRHHVGDYGIVKPDLSIKRSGSPWRALGGDYGHAPW